MKGKKLIDQETGKEFEVINEDGVKEVEQSSNTASGEQSGKGQYARLKKKGKIKRL